MLLRATHIHIHHHRIIFVSSRFVALVAPPRQNKQTRTHDADVSHAGYKRKTMSCFQGEFTAELIATAQKLSTPGKGVLAADESTGTIGREGGCFI